MGGSNVIKRAGILIMNKSETATLLATVTAAVTAAVTATVTSTVTATAIFHCSNKKKAGCCFSI